MKISEILALKKANAASTILKFEPLEVAKEPVVIESRSLSREVGEGIDTTPTNASHAERLWNVALNCLESQLCLMRDPKEPEVIWIAIRPSTPDNWEPILLHKLPYSLYNHPRYVHPEDCPF